MILRLFTVMVLTLLPLLLKAEDEASSTLVWPDGTRYVGGVEDGKRSGKGTILWPDGTKFVGQFENDMRNGPGTMILPDGTVYTGYFRDDELVDSPVIAQGEIVAETPAQPAGPGAESGDDPYRGAEVAAEFEAEVTEVTEGVKSDLIEAIDVWRQAWSDQNVPQYLASYSEAFDVPGKQSRSQWEALRRTRLQRPDYIDVNVNFAGFELIEPNVVDVTFAQTYRSDVFSDKTDKVLRMRKEGVYWRILEERSR